MASCSPLNGTVSFQLVTVLNKAMKTDRNLERQLMSHNGDYLSLWKYHSCDCGDPWHAVISLHDDVLSQIANHPTVDTTSTPATVSNSQEVISRPVTTIADTTCINILQTDGCMSDNVRSALTLIQHLISHAEAQLCILRNLVNSLFQGEAYSHLIEPWAHRYAQIKVLHDLLIKRLHASCGEPAVRERIFVPYTRPALYEQLAELRGAYLTNLQDLALELGIYKAELERRPVNSPVLGILQSECLESNLSDLGTETIETMKQYAQGLLEVLGWLDKKSVDALASSTASESSTDEH
ncbi:MAG: hypothetical protein Q9227_004591 [Pyrenula ochraceoflavens]